MAGLLVACDRAEEDAPLPPPAVTVMQPAQRQVTDWDEFTGRFVEVERVEVRARVSGYLSSVDFADGQVVRRGDLLYRIDPRPFQAAVAAAQGRLDEARSRLVLAEQERNRTADLLRARAASEANADQRLQGVAGTRAQVAENEAALRRAELDLEFTMVRAPLEGRIGRHLVSPGNLVVGGEGGAATLLATIVTVDPIDFTFDIDQAAGLRYTRLAQSGSRPSSRDFANPVQLALADESGFPHVGRVVFVDNEADSGTGTIRLRARFENPGGALLVPGLFARVRLIASAPYPALLVPDAAVATDQSRRVVYVLGEGDRIVAREVLLGALDGGLRVVRSGLRAEEEVVIRGMPRIRVGATVRPERMPAGTAMPTSPAP